MQLYQQVGLCVAPLLIAVVMYTSMIQPALDESSIKGNQLDGIKQQYQILEIKLRQKQKLLAKRKVIHREIEKLRNSVPDQPDLDLFILDLEKICGANQVDLLGIEEDEPHRAKKTKAGLIASLVNEVGGKMPLAGKKKTRVNNRRKNKNAKKEEEKDPLGLKHATRRVYISGKFAGMVGVLKNLENYQRVVGIRDLVIAMPEDDEKEMIKTLASEKGKELGLVNPVMTFLLHIYYLPS